MTYCVGMIGHYTTLHYTTLHYTTLQPQHTGDAQISPTPDQCPVRVRMRSSRSVSVSVIVSTLWWRVVTGQDSDEEYFYDYGRY